MSSAADLLPVALEASVPLWIAELRHSTFEERARRAHRCAGIIAGHGDDVLYRSKRKGATAAAFNALAESIAIGAFAPGGIKVFGRHWEAAP